MWRKFAVACYGLSSFVICFAFCKQCQYTMAPVGASHSVEVSGWLDPCIFAIIIQPLCMTTFIIRVLLSVLICQNGRRGS